jgi:signal transduction histidine kinase
MKFGLKNKIILVLAAVLVLTTVLNALLASYFTDRQNRDEAFAVLSRDLLAWENDLQDLTLQLRAGALAAVSDATVLNQLAEEVTLQFHIDHARSDRESRARSPTMGFVESVSLNRLQLALRTGGFSSIAVYTGGALSHYVTAREAGMLVGRGTTHPVWLRAAADSAGNLPVQNWPAWAKDAPPADLPRTVREPGQPVVSFEFPDSNATVIQIAVPVAAVIEDLFVDSDKDPVARYLSHVSIARGGAPQLARRPGSGAPRPSTFAVIVFRRTIDAAALERVARQTGKLPALLSPDGTHRQLAARLGHGLGPILAGLRPDGDASSPREFHGTVVTDRGSFYVAMISWSFQGRPRLLLAMASSRGGTWANIRQTVTAILMVSAIILALSLVLGTLGLARFIDPTVALTAQVREITLQHRQRDSSDAAYRSALARLRPVDIKAPDEIGELAGAFNAMIAELRQSFETLETRVLQRTAELQRSNEQLEREIVERTRAEKVLALRSEELVRSNAELEQLAYVASHDLQEPLRMVASYLQLLEQRYRAKLDTDAHEFIAFAVDGAKRMQALINDLLAYSRVGSGSKQVQPVDCEAVMNAAMSNLRVVLQESGAQITRDPFPTVMGDGTQLTQLFQNLVSNAIRFRNDSVPKIDIRAEAQDGFWRFSVQDNGIGIEPEYFERIFALFQRLHGRTAYPGTGIGLAICKKIVERHGGRIWVESAPERGSTFWFTLPRERREQP